MLVKIGDLVRMKSIIPPEDAGLVLAFHGVQWAEVLWPEDGLCLEKIRDIEIAQAVDSIEREIETLAMSWAD
tara:strand:+ start:2160 stop:2375 length:216 start_codon:yes stop_codon:yes gene_type:complete